MDKVRLEAFSDGVLAIIITIMVLEIKVPHGDTLLVLKPLLPLLLSYILSFVYIGIYWNNHHHMMHTVTQVNGAILWANMHLLFWLSLIPFSSGWMGENHFAKWPVILYGVNLTMCAIAYAILSNSLIKLHGTDSTLAKAIGKDSKGKVSITLYFAGIVLTFFHPMLGMAVYAVVAGIWFIPDRRIEERVED